ncbi:hypothetical protein [Parerythrobacter aestuarii]|uniref:hypothetical protein n=1 Tax=Parerythrobacter aestuarii TaxID=3020909 RepID=UPI0024DEC5E7|nr:hypothetical protein [Parerythrobacter aestuarii]
MPTASVFSNIFVGKRWQVAQYKANDPDPFAKDIYFGMRKVGKVAEPEEETPDPAPSEDQQAGVETEAGDEVPAEGDRDGDGGDTDTAGDGETPPSTPDTVKNSIVDPFEIAFKNRVEQTMSTLKAIYRPPEIDSDRSGLPGLFDRMMTAGQKQSEASRKQRIARFNEAYDRLFSLAALGLGTDDSEAALRGKVNIASGALDALRTDVRNREAGLVKNTYMKKLGMPALLAGLCFLLLYLLYDKSPGFFTAGCGVDDGWRSALPCVAASDGMIPALFPSELYELRNLFVLMAGCMMGTWASFGARKIVLTFDDLAELEQDNLSPVMRLIFTAAMTLILALVFLTGIVQVEIGDFETKSLASNGLIAFLIGAFFGLLEQSLPTAVMDRARGFLESASAK